MSADPSDPTLLWAVGGYWESPSTPTPNTNWSFATSSFRVVGLQLATALSGFTVYPGATGNANVTVQARGGFSGQVNLTASVSPQYYGGPYASVSRSSVQLSVGGSSYTVATANASSDLTPGSFTLVVTTQASALYFSLSIPLTVPYFDFTGTNPSTLAYIQGIASSVSSTITLTSRLNFAGPVSLSISVPSGITASVSSPSVTLSSGGSASFSVTVSTSVSTPGGTYLVKVTGTYGSYSQFVYLTVQVGSHYCTATASPSRGRLSVTVSFTLTCLAGVSSDTWFFNDGTGATSTAQNTTYTYSWSPGGGSTQNFSPTVTVRDRDGNTYYPGVPVITLTCTSGCPTPPSP